MATLEGISSSSTNHSSSSSSRAAYARNRFVQSAQPPSQVTSAQRQQTQQQQYSAAVHQPYRADQRRHLVDQSPARQPVSRKSSISPPHQQQTSLAAIVGHVRDRKRSIDATQPFTDGYAPPPIRRQLSPPDVTMPGPSSRAHSPPRGNAARAMQSYHGGRVDEEEEMALAKRRRLDEAREEAAAYRSRDGRHTDTYDSVSSASTDRMMDRRSIGGEDAYDANVPLARRRGDAAQAKASRLHIDTGYGTEASSTHSGAGGAQHAGGSGEGVRSSEHPSRPHGSSPHANMAHAVKSAPPYKATFFEREHGGGGGAHYDLRGPGPELPAISSSRGGGALAGGHSAAQHGQAQHAAGSAQYYPSTTTAARYARPEDGHGHEPPYEPHDYPGSARRTAADGLPSSAAIPQHAYRTAQQKGGPAGAAAAAGASGTPLTASRMSFVPQTATLPSPAYHTTQFFRNGNGGGGGGGAPPPHTAGAGGANGLNGDRAGTGYQQPPRTAGLNPPMTARLPDHLRSPPSSKTQFLSLFSNFYDSLQDSRTLKATLEDQVRRSNTLLQTLQRSARVLELTVERRLTAERSQWESKVHALEERCRRLERKTGTGSPTPPPPVSSAEAESAEQAQDADQKEAAAAEEKTADADADETMKQVEEATASPSHSKDTAKANDEEEAKDG